MLSMAMPTKTAEWSNCNRDLMTKKTKIFTILGSPFEKVSQPLLGDNWSASPPNTILT